ncbi:hypothetical protein P885DRAFT_60942 [Corynascus similis CBS 632.67]
MHRFSGTLATCMALVAQAVAQQSSAVSIVSVSGCAAVVSTTDVCTTCMTVACVVPATITAGCGDCGESPPTIYRSFPCDEGCNNLGCKTVYSIVTATTDSDCTASPTPTPTQDPENPTGSDEATDVVTETSASTAGAARMMPFRLW